MPPKKRLRGPKLPPVLEESTSEKEKSVEAEKSELKPKILKITKTIKQIEQNDADFDIIDKTTTVVEKPLTISAKTVFAQKTLRENITASIRLVFQARSNFSDNIRMGAQQLLNAYKKTSRVRAPIDKETFFNELDIRLCMIIESLSVIEHRARVLKMVCETACNLLIETDDTTILDFLVNTFFECWSKSSEIDARTNIASFIGYLFETGISKKKSPQDIAIFDLNTTRKLYRFLLRFVKDKVQVRVAAIRAFSVIQSIWIPNNFEEATEITPREVLMRSFRDIAWECRLAAIESFIPIAEQVTPVANLALFDKNTKVRCVALDKFGGMMLRDSDSSVKLDLLYTCLNDHDVNIREATRELVIKKWIKRLAKTYKKKYDEKNDVDEIIETDASGQPMSTIEMSRPNITGYGYAAQFISCYFCNILTTETRSQVKFVIMHVLDMARQLYDVHLDEMDDFARCISEDVVDDNLQIFTRNTYTDIAYAKCELEVRVSLVLFWTILIEYLSERGSDKNSAMHAVERMAPRMVKMADLVKEVLIDFKQMEESEMQGFNRPIIDWELFYDQKFSILQNLLIVLRYLDRDPTGMKCWKNILEEMIFNINTPKSLLDTAMQDYAEHFFKDDPQAILLEVSGQFSDMMNRMTKSEETIQNETMFIGATKTKTVTSEIRQTIEAIADYELMVFNSMLKTGIFTSFDEILKTKYETLAIQKLSSKVVEERIWAMECVAMIGMIDLEMIRDELPICANIAEIDVISVKSCYIVSIVDLCVIHGTDVIQDILTKNKSKKETKSIVSMICDIILTEDPEIKNSEIVLKCCEGLGKLLLHEKIDPDDERWRRALIALLSRLNYKFDGRCAAKLRSMITTMLKFFASLSRSNQMALIKCFKPFFTEWDNNPNLIENAGSSEHIYQRLCRCAALFVILTRHSLLLPSQQKEKPCHIDLLSDAFAELTGDQESSASNYYSEIMSWIELDSICKTDLGKILEDLNDLVDMYEEDDSKGRLSELKKLKKRILKKLGMEKNAEEIDIEIKQEVIEEGEDHLILEQSATIKKSKRNVGRSAIKTPSTAQKKNVVEEIRNLIDSPIREKIQKKSVRQTTEKKRGAARKLKMSAN